MPRAAPPFVPVMDPGRFRNRRGSAMLLALIFTLSIAALATSVIYMGGNSTMLAASFEKERDLKYAAEAALAIGKSRLNFDPIVLPQEGYVALMEDAEIYGADDKPVEGVTVNLYVGPTSSSTGQFGRFASVVAEAKDRRGSRFVRRLELAQESFAKFAYWSDRESNMGTVIVFGGNDQLWGPVWSNDKITISENGGATFHNHVGTANVIDGFEYGVFMNGYSESERPIPLPDNSTLSYLPGFAESGKLNFVAPNAGDPSNVMMRLEFVAIDLDGDGKTDGAEEGFLRVYRSTANSQWLTGDSSSKDLNCGAFYNIGTGGEPRFVPLIEHSKVWFKSALDRIAFPGRADFFASPLSESVREKVLSLPSAQCFLGGDPHLKAVNMPPDQYAAAASLSGVAAADALGGTPESFTATGNMGSWLQWTGPVDSRLGDRPDKNYLFPLYRGQNPGVKGVVYVDGSVALSGDLRGRVTLYAAGNVLIVDDVKYTTDPATGKCRDILGVIATSNIVVSDNTIQTPQPVNTVYRKLGKKSDVFIHGIMMSLNTSFFVENYSSGVTSASTCGERAVSRGCLYLTGGLIQQARGPVGTVGSTVATGFIKRYSYDRCAMYNPPPYFPTTGRYTENRYYEIDPANFDVAELFASLMPRD